MVKLIAADMDGTLLNAQGKVTEETKRVIEEFQSQGGIFAISTGRDYSMAYQPIKKAGIECDFICASGAAIHHTDGSIYREIIFEQQTSQAITDILTTHGAYVELFTSEGRMTTVSKDMANEYLYGEWIDTQMKGKIIPTYEKSKEIADILFKDTRQNVIIDGLYNTGIKVYKICTAMLDLELIQKIKQECSRISGVVVEASFRYNIELTVTGAQKGPAVLEFAKEHGIAKEEIMVLGDSDNDKSMMSMDFGYSVAMGNATEEIKSLAKYITRTNDEEGVAHAIKTHILNRR